MAGSVTTLWIFVGYQLSNKANLACLPPGFSNMTSNPCMGYGGKRLMVWCQM